LSDLPLAERLEELLRDHFEIEPEALRPEATFAELEMDSLAMVEVLAILEDEEDVRLPDGVNGLSPRTTLAEGFRLISEAVAEVRRPATGGTAAGAGATAGVAGATESSAGAQTPAGAGVAG
jgi:acyl carrier protein